jgi:hypothetical protein
MKSATTNKVGTGTHKPLVTGLIPVAATKPLISASSTRVIARSEVKWQSCDPEQGTLQNRFIALYLDSVMIENLKLEVE